ncbi:MAG: Purine nucleoside phosphorylase DeoD-type [candidate division BRC1 bacterium ADurb.BinA364]|nr:MAG: Purine nucleoside phosphorylase DeoD-type [candidate division BRC1 bacterium ADurb.BinA364]
MPLSAVRDEGVSYHYAPPSREIAPTDAALNALRRTLQARGEPFAAGKTWTTDAFYRETPARVARRRGEGCLTVEMESAAFFAVARFRGVEFAQLLYAEDDVASEVWSSRRKAFDRKAVRARMLELAIEACLAMESGFERARGTA